MSGNKILCLGSCGKSANVFTSCSQSPAFLQAFSLQSRIMKVVYPCLLSCCQCFTSSAPAEHISLYAMAAFSRSNHTDSLHDGSPNLCSVMHHASPRRISSDSLLMRGKWWHYHYYYLWLILLCRCVRHFKKQIKMESLLITKQNKKARLASLWFLLQSV